MTHVTHLLLPPQLSGYTYVATIYQGDRTTVYRAIETTTQRPVVIKAMAQEYPSLAELVQFRNQYTVAQNLSFSGIVRPLSLESCGNGYALVMEDSGSQSLATYVEPQTLSLTEILAIMIQLADILHKLHQHRIIHKDIKPANILIHPESKQVQLIDFSIASLLPQESQVIQSPKSIEGTLAYLAPEQTGRMNRVMDYRTDFYALGVTLYQLLTGQLPFTSSDPLELLHCHMAQQPIAVEQVNPAVPLMVGAIATKLMAKNAEDRYQTALGLKHDLEQCRNQWQEREDIAEFELGQRDVSDRFLIPEQLYGRKTEVQTLLNAFDRVAHGASELTLVAGFSGIGKTAVINEVQKPIVRQRGYFIKGKFDQFNRNIPFSAFVQAFQDLVGQLLSENDTELQAWKTQILEVLDDNAQVMINLLPTLETLIGPQPPDPKLSGTAAQNRFNLLFQKFIQVFTTAEHPLVIFVDDLQWADAASLQLIQLLMTEVETGYLLLLGAYRDNEVFPAHPLMLTLDEMGNAQVTINRIILQPLAETSLNHLVIDALHTTPQVAQPLTNLVMHKTQGNPFFATQFLRALHQNQLITFNRNTREWQYDITAIQDAALTDDVVKFMAQQLQILPQATLKVLTLAACIGAQFDLETLAIISEQSQIETAAALWQALQSGFVLPTSQIYKRYQTYQTVEPDIERPTQDLIQDSIERTEDERHLNPSYRFLHDRVQQAAYSLIDSTQRASTHWHIGNLLWLSGAEQQADKIFDLVNQLNLGQSVISQATQQQQLAQLNLQAAQRAKLSAASKAVQSYCEIGIALLSSNAWDVNYDLIYALYYHGSEAAYLDGQFDQAERLYQVVLQQAKTPLDQAAIYRIQMTQYQLQGRNAEAIQIQRTSTKLLGWSIPTEPEEIQRSLDAEVATVNDFLAQQAIASILDRPQMTDAHVGEMLRILQILFYSAWLDGQPTLALLALAKMTTLSLEHGNSEMSPFGYVGYGLIANIVLQDAAQAYQFGYMAVQLCERFNNADVSSMTNFLFAADVHSWTRSLREVDQYYDNAYKYAMAAGNWLTVSFTMMLSGSDRLTYGKTLDDLHEITQTQVAFLQHIKSLENLDALTVGVLQPVRQLLGLTASPHSFDDDNFSESAYLQKYQNTPYHLAWYYSVKIRHAYLFGQVDDYPALIPKVEIINSTIPTHAKHPSTVFYVALMHLALIDSTSNEAQQATHWRAIELLENKLIKWQQDCPENIAHKCLLVQAEKARLRQQIAVAIDCYEQAIAQAQAHDYHYEAALAQELAATFYLGWNKPKVAAGYMQAAYYDYFRWGAKTKVADLETRYPELLKPILKDSVASESMLNLLMTATNSTSALPSSSSSKCPSPSSTGLSKTLDFASVLKASQALASIIQLDELLCQLTQIILQNSGGDSCALIFPNDANEWQVRALSQHSQDDLSASSSQLCTEPLNDNSNLPVKLIQYVKNTQEIVVVDDLKTDLPVVDTYLTQQQPKSVLCLPMINQGHLIGIVYLKNRFTGGIFTEERILVLNFLCTQAAIALRNAHLYKLEQRQKSQLALSEQRYKTIFENAADATLLLSNQGFVDCNQACVELFGLPNREAIVSLHPAELSPEFQSDGQPSFDKANTIMQSAYEKGHHQFEWLHQRCNGEVFWAEVMLTPILYTDDSGEVIDCLHSVVRDISDRKSSEIALQESEAHYRALVNAIPDLIMRVNRNGIHLECTAFAQFPVLGNVKDWTGKHVTDLVPPHLAQEQLAAIRTALDTQSTQLYEQVLHIDGKTQYEEVRAVPYVGDEVLLLVRDISDRKRAEESSKAFQERLTFLIEETPIGIIEWNPDYTVAAWNPAAEDIFGYSAIEMVGRHAIEIVPESDRPLVAQVMTDLMANRGGFYSLNQNIHKDGSIVYCEWINTPLRNKQGETVGIFSMVQNITERKRGQELILQKSRDLEKALTDLQNTQLKLVKNEKMSALGGLVSGVAHEINNPVGCILGNVGATQDYINDLLGLLDRYAKQFPEPGPEIQAELEAVDLEYVREDLPKLIRAMKDSGDRIASMSKSLRTFSRNDTNKKQLFNLHEGIDSTVLILRHRLKANQHRPNIEVVKDYGDIPKVNCLPGQLNQVFMNILANAIDALDEVSHNRSVADIQAAPQCITIRTSLDDHQVNIAITDNGPGIPEAIRANIFDNLFTTKEVGKGTGLGLAIARQIVEKTHGGTLEVWSEVGQGSKFCIRLPL